MTGLLGVPLPEGATLIEQQPGDPSAGRDPSQGYAIAETAADIEGFFNQAMPRAGWAQDGISTHTALIFRKNNLVIGVLINSNGGKFTLMGS